MDNQLSVPSPTYTIEIPYGIVHHVDLFRLHPTDPFITQLQERMLMDKSKIYIVEWASKLQKVEGARLEIHLDVQVGEDGNEQRCMKMVGYGAEWQDRLAKFT